MRIVVCIKQVGYIYHPAAIDLSTGHIDREKMVFMLNPYDEVAVEEGIKIKESFSDCELIMITAGSLETERALRYAFAMGGGRKDRMIRINYEGFDPWETSLVLAAVIRRLEFDLILCGKKAIDNNSSEVGTFIAELIDIPQVSGIVKLNLLPEARKAIVEKYLGKGDREEIECHLPALFTVEMGLNDPRYPSVPNRILAEKMEVEEIDPISLGFRIDREEGLTRVKKFSPPRPKTKKIFTPDSSLSPFERLYLVMSGGAMKKEGSNIFEGTVDQLAENIVKFLVQNKLLSKEGEK